MIWVNLLIISDDHDFFHSFLYVESNEEKHCQVTSFELSNAHRPSVVGNLLARSILLNENSKSKPFLAFHHIQLNCVFFQTNDCLLSETKSLRIFFFARIYRNMHLLCCCDSTIAIAYRIFHMQWKKHLLMTAIKSHVCSTTNIQQPITKNISLTKYDD